MKNTPFYLKFLSFYDKTQHFFIFNSKYLSFYEKSQQFLYFLIKISFIL
jgi:hypothetical protein